MEILKINGVEREFAQGVPATLTELLAQMNINKATIVAQVDGAIIEKKNFSQTKLSKNQKIELVKFMGGG